MALYSLKKNNIDEWHIFECHDENIFLKHCVCESQSICQRMTIDDKNKCLKNDFTCLNEEEARLKCAEMGRVVCGTCVSSLYGNINKK